MLIKTLTNVIKIILHTNIKNISKYQGEKVKNVSHFSFPLARIVENMFLGFIQCIQLNRYMCTSALNGEIKTPCLLFFNKMTNLLELKNNIQSFLFFLS